MKKPIVNMTNWELYVYNGRYNLSGVGDNHPELGRDVYIYHTSSLVNSDFEEDVLTYETRNTIYKCPLKYMTMYPYVNVISECKKELARMLKSADNWLDKIIAASACIALDRGKKDAFVKHIMELQQIGEQELTKKEEEENKRLFEVVKQYEDCVYIEVSNVEQGNKLAYHLEDCFGVVKPHVHGGMFQDSVLYMKYEGEDDNDCGLDFRYFPRGFSSMETYSWSDNIKQAVIKNEGSSPLYFNGEAINPGDIKVFTPNTHKQGLMSPDCYNGKSLFDMFGGE